MPRRLLPIIAIACPFLLSGCGAMDKMKEESDHSQAVSNELEQSLGVKSLVGFESTNGALGLVTVTFEHIPPKLTLEEIALKSKQAVISQFKQTPGKVIIAFSLDP
jgi:hypothetical protein